MKLTSLYKTLLFSACACWIGGTYLQAAGRPQVSDIVIVESIKNKIEDDRIISSTPIVVTSHHGRVKVSGVFLVDSDASKTIEIAESTDGVKYVDVSNIVVKRSEQPWADTVITAKVKGRLLKEKLFDSAGIPLNIQVETKNGITYLTGKVSTVSDVNKSIQIAKSVKGVKAVVSKLTLVNA